MYHLFIVIGRHNCTMNIHLLCHLATCVRNWGPLWAYSCFPFEGMNFHLKLFHGTRDKTQQVNMQHLNLCSYQEWLRFICTILQHITHSYMYTDGFCLPNESGASISAGKSGWYICASCAKGCWCSWKEVSVNKCIFCTTLWGVNNTPGSRMCMIELHIGDVTWVSLATGLKNGLQES